MFTDLMDAVEPSPRDALMLFSEQLGLPVGCSLRHLNEVGEPDFGEHEQLAVQHAAKHFVKRPLGNG
jgi:hypothetical protein